LRAADAACYAAKKQGRNCVAVHQSKPVAGTAGADAAAEVHGPQRQAGALTTPVSLLASD
jgi:hypothetical protein